MILFLDEDRAYLNWVTHHRAGFVLECHRDLTKGYNVLHRATCRLIKQLGTKRSHWTTGRLMKCCALDDEQIASWLNMQAQLEPEDCAECAPHLAISAETHLTKLDHEIVDYVLEIAAMALDDDGHGYQVTVGMIANCLKKTPGQLAASFGRLVVNGLLSITGQNHVSKASSPRSHVFPTTKALRLLDYYRGFDEQEITAELEKLTDE